MMRERERRTVPGLLTNGKTTQVVPGAQGVISHLEDTHCANELDTHAISVPRKYVRLNMVW